MRGIVSLVLLILAVDICQGVRAGRRSPLPLKSRNDVYSKQENVKASVCQFGGQTFELEEMWNPDLGAPFGVMSCIQCQCVPVQRKRRIIGRVRCHDLKRSCVKPECAKPVLPPGQCCKTCHHGTNNATLANIRVEPYADVKASIKYGSLLTPWSVGIAKGWLNSTVVNGAEAEVRVATARFTLHGRELTYSFLYSGRADGHSLAVVFVDQHGNIIEQLAASHSSLVRQHAAANSKLCGRWSKVPRKYRRMLRRGLMHVALASPLPDGPSPRAVSPLVHGKIIRYSGIESETFSSLLLADSGVGRRRETGTAVVSVTGGRPAALHVTAMLRHLWPHDQQCGWPQRVTVLLTSNDAQDDTATTSSTTLATLLNQTLEVDCSMDEVVVEASAVLTISQTRKLAAGECSVRVLLLDSPVVPHQPTPPARALHGRLVSRATCNIYTAVLAGATARSVDPAPPPYGFGIVELHNNGRLQLTAQLLDTAAGQLLLTADAPDDADLYRVLADLSPWRSHNWVNGTIDRLRVRDVMALYDGRVSVRVSGAVAPDSSRSPRTAASQDMHARLAPLIVSRALDDARDGSVEQWGMLSSRGMMANVTGRRDGQVEWQMPWPLRSANHSTTGAVWLSVDNACVLHYQLQLSGWTADWSGRLEMNELVPSTRSQQQRHRSAADGWQLMMTGERRTKRSRLLKQFDTGDVLGSVRRLPRVTLRRLRRGRAVTVHVQLSSAASRAVSLHSDTVKVYVSGECLPGVGVSMVGFHQDQAAEDQNEIEDVNKCVYKDTVFEDGEQWDAEHDSCVVCSCHSGRVFCEPVLCAPLNCKHGQKPPHPGQCCPSCLDMGVSVGGVPGDSGGRGGVSNSQQEEEEGCMMAGKRRSVGSSWHPLLPPLGYDRCIVCTCLRSNKTRNSAGRVDIECVKRPCSSVSCRADGSGLCCDHCRLHQSAPSEPSPAVISHHTNHGVVAMRGVMQDEARADSSSRPALARGGGHCVRQRRLYNNGDSWHPHIDSVGLLPCLTCHCRDGVVTCQRRTCPELTCVRAIKLKDECCAVCVSEVTGSRDPADPVNARLDSDFDELSVRGRRNSHIAQ